MLKFKEYLAESQEHDGEMHPYLQFLTSPHGIPDDPSLHENTVIPIHQIKPAATNPLRRAKQAFDHIGNGNNPHTGEKLPTYGSKEYKKVVSDAHSRLKEHHNVDPKNLLAGNKKLQDSSGSNIKDKEGKEVFSQGLSLSPADDRHGINTCPKASKECKSACLAHTSGAMARAQATKDAKKRKTDALFKSPEDMAIALHHHISKEEKLAKKDGTYNYSARMNTTSDIPQSVYHGLRKAHPDTQFYDYTKEHKQVLHNLAHKNEEGHKNLHLTFSSTGVHHDESNWKHAREVLKSGGNVAMVSTSKNAIKGTDEKEKNKLPKVVHDHDTGEKWPTVDGDGRSKDMEGHGDARFLDKPGHVAMLHLKGVNPKAVGNFAVPHDKDRVAHVSEKLHRD